MTYNAICNLCGRPRSEHKNGATGKNLYLIMTFPRHRCPPDFKKGGDIVGDRQFAKILRVKEIQSVRVEEGD